MFLFDDRISAESLAVERVRSLAQASQLPELALTEIWRARTIEELRRVVESLKPSELRYAMEATIGTQALEQSIRPTIVAPADELADEADDEEVVEDSAA